MDEKGSSVLSVWCWLGRECRVDKWWRGENYVNPPFLYPFSDNKLLLIIVKMATFLLKKTDKMW